MTDQPKPEYGHALPGRLPPNMTPSEQLAQRILAGGLPMLAQYVAEVTLRLDEMARREPLAMVFAKRWCSLRAEDRAEPGRLDDERWFATLTYLDEMAADKPEPPTALTELRTIPGATGANAESTPDYLLYSQLCEQRDTLKAQLSKARAALAELEQARVEYLALSRAELARVEADLREAKREANTCGRCGEECESMAENTCEDCDELNGLELTERIRKTHAAELAKVTAERDTLTARVTELATEREHGIARKREQDQREASLLDDLREAKLQSLCDMHHTSMRHRKYGREPAWLGAAFTELRAKYEAELEGKPE